MTDTLSLTDSFGRALDDILARVRAFRGDVQAIAVACSGGLDSSALLHLAHDHASARNLKLFAFHVHHGLSANADAWLAHCEAECAQIGVRFDARRIALENRKRSGVEEAARIARYAALGEMCRAHDIPLLLTAHHRDDQAETVLLHLLRGAGVAGLSGMEEIHITSDLLGADTTAGRPLLAFSRAELAVFAEEKRIAYVEDESNADPRYTRNALRRHAIPVLEEWFPGFQSRIARTAQHAQAAQRLLSELAAGDLEACAAGREIDLTRLRLLGPDRIDNALRHWFRMNGTRMPSTAQLHEIRAQLLHAKGDAQVCVELPGCEVRRYKGRAYLGLRRADMLELTAQSMFSWAGEAAMHFEKFRGTLHFDRSDEGLEERWLRAQPLTLRYRTGGERLKLAANRPARSLKQHYQALQVPSWERQQPLVAIRERVLFVAGLGTDSRFMKAHPAGCVRLRWEAEDARK